MALSSPTRNGLKFSKFLIQFAKINDSRKCLSLIVQWRLKKKSILLVLNYTFIRKTFQVNKAKRLFVMAFHWPIIRLSDF